MIEKGRPAAKTPEPAADAGFFAPVELTDDEMEMIRAEALAEAKAEQKRQKIAAAKQAALAQARAEMGLMSRSETERKRLAEIVAITIDIPEGGSRDGDKIWLDGREFLNGRTYQVTRAQFETLADIQNKQWVEWAKFKGEISNHYNRLRGRYQQAYGGGVAAGGTNLATPHGGVPAYMEQA